MNYSRILALVLVPMFFVYQVSSVAAHEFWFEPLSYKVQVGDKVQAHLKNGQNFKGTTYSYVNEIFVRFDIATPNGVEPVIVRRGDRPALNVEAKAEGLHVPIYGSTMQWVRYNKLEKFESFVRSVKLDWVLEAHKERGYPSEKVLETYYRYAKSLIAVGSGKGKDRFYDLPIEFVALTNPYVDNTKDGVRVQLFLEGKPFVGADVQIFHYVAGSEDAVMDRTTTDAQGMAIISVFEGGSFLINAVDIRDPRPEGVKKGAHWETIWATLTYELPAG